GRRSWTPSFAIRLSGDLQLSSDLPEGHFGDTGHGLHFPSGPECTSTTCAPALSRSALHYIGERTMGLLSKPIKTLDDLFVHHLQDLYYAEQQITKALPKMITKVSDAQLKRGFEIHLGETRNHINRLERVFQMHGESPKSVNCPAIDGIIEEANEILGDARDQEVLDAAALAAAQAVEHYESACYGT